MKDIFQKYDITENNFLSFKEFKAFCDKVGLTMDRTVYKEYLMKYDKENFGHFTEQDFFRIFDDFLGKLDLKGQKRVFDILGYDEYLYSYKSRVFSFSVHSMKPVQCKIEDAFKICIDMVVKQLLTKELGENIDTSAERDKSEIQGFYYFNKKIHCYTYCVYNRST